MKLMLTHHCCNTIVAAYPGKYRREGEEIRGWANRKASEHPSANNSSTSHPQRLQAESNPRKRGIRKGDKSQGLQKTFPYFQVFLAERIKTQTICAIKVVDKEVAIFKYARASSVYSNYCSFPQAELDTQVIIENDDIDITMLEREVLALGVQECRSGSN